MGTTWSYLDATPLGHPEDLGKTRRRAILRAPPYKWWNWHDNYAAEAAPDPKWVEVSDAGEATTATARQARRHDRAPSHRL